MQSGLLGAVCREMRINWPQAYADILGGAKYPEIGGTVEFYEWREGTIVAIEIEGLPKQMEGKKNPILGFHIHEGNRCSGNSKDNFADVLGHFNPQNVPHPEHAGDMPPIFANNGEGMMIFYTERFRPEDIIGKTVILHDMPDDFRTEPSGNSGEKIACGEIQEVS